VALRSTGRKREALKLLDRALARRPGERDMLLAAATFSRDTGDHAAALKYAERLAAEAPWDAAAQHLVRELRRGADTEP
jgi:tetratricopeptide (TPR) repeat protein